MRAGYLATALAVLGAVAFSLVLGVGRTPAPASVAAALGFDGVEDPGLGRRRALEVARQTAACMAERGFPYQAIPAPEPAIPDPGLDPVRWAERWGFGVSTAAGLPEPPPLPDANAVYAAGLDATARGRYGRALHGDDDDPGCLTAATQTVYGLRERRLAPLRDELITLEHAIESDPAMKPVRGAWQACVTQVVAGLGVDSSMDRASLPSALLHAFVARLAHDRADPARLARLRAVERRVATGVARCEAAFMAARAGVALAHEGAFVRAHADALERIGSDILDTEARYGASP